MGSLIMEKELNLPLDSTLVTHLSCHSGFDLFRLCICTYQIIWVKCSFAFALYLSALKLFNMICLFLCQLSIKESQALTGTELVFSAVTTGSVTQLTSP